MGEPLGYVFPDRIDQEGRMRQAGSDEHRPTRRDVVAASIAAAAGSAALGIHQTITLATPPAPPADPRRGLRIAHLTDMHVQPELRGGEGFAAALESLKRLDPPPAFVVTGG